MARKKKRGQKSRKPQARPLEDLLRNGEAEFYGQVCWSIANRGTEGPKPGEVIGVEGSDENGDATRRAFRLTRKSV